MSGQLVVKAAHNLASYGPAYKPTSCQPTKSLLQYVEPTYCTSRVVAETPTGLLLLPLPCPTVAPPPTSLEKDATYFFQLPKSPAPEVLVVVFSGKSQGLRVAQHGLDIMHKAFSTTLASLNSKLSQKATSSIWLGYSNYSLITVLAKCSILMYVAATYWRYSP